MVVYAPRSGEFAARPSRARPSALGTEVRRPHTTQRHSAPVSRPPNGRPRAATARHLSDPLSPSGRTPEAGEDAAPRRSSASRGRSRRNSGRSQRRNGPLRRSSTASRAATACTRSRWVPSTFHGPGWSVATPNRHGEKPRRSRRRGGTRSNSPVMGCLPEPPRAGWGPRSGRFEARAWPCGAQACAVRGGGGPVYSPGRFLLGRSRSAWNAIGNGPPAAGRDTGDGTPPIAL